MDGEAAKLLGTDYSFAHSGEVVGVDTCLPETQFGIWKWPFLQLSMLGEVGLGFKHGKRFMLYIHNNLSVSQLWMTCVG